MKVPKVDEPTNKKSLLKTLGIKVSEVVKPMKKKLIIKLWGLE